MSRPDVILMESAQDEDNDLELAQVERVIGAVTKVSHPSEIATKVADILERPRSIWGHAKIGRLQLIGHGGPGFLSMGSTRKTDDHYITAAVSHLLDTMEPLRYYLDEQSQIFLLGCNTCGYSEPTADGLALHFAVAGYFDCEVFTTLHTLEPVDFGPDGFKTSSYHKLLAFQNGALQTPTPPQPSP